MKKILDFIWNRKNTKPAFCSDKVKPAACADRSTRAAYCGGRFSTLNK